MGVAVRERIGNLEEILWEKSLRLLWLLHWPQVRFCRRHLQGQRMVKSPPASWADLSEVRSAAPWCVLLLRRRFIMRLHRSTSKNPFADWFASATGTDMAGNFAGSRFAIDRAFLAGRGLNELESGRPIGGRFRGCPLL